MTRCATEHLMHFGLTESLTIITIFNNSNNNVFFSDTVGSKLAPRASYQDLKLTVTLQ